MDCVVHGVAKSQTQLSDFHKGEKARKLQTNVYFCFIDYTKAFDCLKVK